MGYLQIIAGRYEEAIDSSEHVRTVDPDFPYVDLHLARASDVCRQAGGGAAPLGDPKK